MSLIVHERSVYNAVISFGHYDFEKKTNMESILDEYVSEEDLKASFNDSLSPKIVHRM